MDSIRRILGISVLSLFATGLVSCSQGVAELSPACEQTVLAALASEKELYDTHPLWAAEIPGVDATPEEFEAFEALQADEEAQWTAIYAPIYVDCESPADWWAAANKHPGIAGLTDTKFLKPEDIQVWCSGNESQPACTGIDEWLASGPR